MPIRCPDCGRDNRDTANFCVGCGRRELQALVIAPQLQPVLQPTAQPLASGGQAPVVPPPAAALAPSLPPPSPSVRSSSGRRLPWKQAAPILEGAVEIYNQDEVYPPPDHMLALAKIAVGMAVLPLALYFFAGLGMLIILVIVLGGGVILAVFGALIGAFTKLFSLIMPRRCPDDRKITQVHLVVQENNGRQSAVLLYGDYIAGMLHKGDLIKVHGRRQRNGVVRAVRVEVIGTQFAPGAVVGRVVKGKPPFPVFIAAGAWIGAVAAWLLFYLPPILQLMQH